MLQKTVLMINENILQEKVLYAENNLLDDLRAHGIEISVVDGCDTYNDAQTIQMNSGVLTRDNTEEETLYITDSENTYHVLRRQGKYVLPYRHEGSSDADFAGALYVIEQIEEVGYETIDMAYRRLAGLPWEIMTTKRCIIRETTEEDVDSFYLIYAEEEITKYMENLYANRDEEIAYTRDYRDKVYGFYGYGMWTVLTKEGTVIGRAGISWREGFDLPELGFVIGVPWQRQGYAYEVCSAILSYAQEELGMTQIQALVMLGNAKSEALCRKLGFQHMEEITIDGLMYAQMVCDFCEGHGRLG